MQVRAKLEGMAPEYPTFAELEVDVLLIFDNAIAYNPPSNMVHQVGGVEVGHGDMRIWGREGRWGAGVRK